MLDVPDWQFERLSRSSVRRLREDGIDLTLIAIGNKKKEITSESLLRVTPSQAQSAKQNKLERTSSANPKIAKQSKRKVTTPKTKKKPTSPRNTKQTRTIEKRKARGSGVRKKPTPAVRIKKNIETKPSVNDDDRVFLEELISIGDSDILRKLAGYARTLGYTSTFYDIVNKNEEYTKEETNSAEECSNFLVEEPDDLEYEENNAGPQYPHTEHIEPPSSHAVPWKQPRVLQVGQVVRTTVSAAKNMPHVPIVRQDKVVNRVLEVGGRKIRQTVPASAAEHIDASCLTAAQIQQFQKQGFVLKSMKPAERDAIFKGK